MNGQVKIQECNKQPKLAKKTKNASSESEEFELQFHQIKKLGLPVNKKKLRIGNWAPEENLIYLKFLQGNKKDFVSEQERRKNKVFYRLSKILKKRTPDQCRSHHQKLQTKYEDDIEEIIQSIRRKLEKKSPEVLWEEVKKTENENKKTGVVDKYQVQKQERVVLEEGEFYKIMKKGQNQFELQIFVDQIKSWF